MTYSEMVADKRHQAQEVKRKEQESLAIVNAVKDGMSKISTPVLEAQDKRIIDAMQAISDNYSKLTSLVSDNSTQLTTDVLDALKETASHIESLRLQPKDIKNNVDVKVDTKGIEKTLKDTLTNGLKSIELAITPKEVAKEAERETEKPELSDYVASDINNADQNTQYIGFVHPEGYWYIVENIISDNKLRFVFGESGYSEAFAKAGTFKYKLVNEAYAKV